MTVEGVRCFVAVELPDSLRAGLAEVQRGLRGGGRDLVKWVAASQVHITLKFLGHVDAARLPAIEERLAEIGRAARSFELSIAGLGAFPSPRRPRVIWVGIERGSEEMRALQEAADEAMYGLGFARERRPFSPHLTLGRVREAASPAQIQELAQHLATTSVPVLGSTSVTSITFMRSQLTPAGPIYSQLAILPLDRA